MRNFSHKCLKPKANQLLLLWGCFAFSAQVSAQKEISLEAAIDTAIQNNLTIKSEKLKAEYKQKLIGTSASIPQAVFSTEAGQINSIYSDNKFGISQAFNFPVVYSRQKQVLQEEWKTAALSVSLKQADIRKAVTQMFYSLLLWKEKEKLLIQSDSAQTVFMMNVSSKANAKLLDKITSEAEKENIRMQLNALKEDIEIAKLQFNLLLNARNRYVPEPVSIQMSLLETTDGSGVQNHPLLRMLEEQKEVAAGNTALEKSKFLPQLTVGYYNMNMRGTGADDVIYNADHRFSSIQVGIGIPLFFGAQKAQVEASKASQEIAENDYRLQLQALEKQLQSVLIRYQTSQATVSYYEREVLPRAALASKTAGEQLRSGTISNEDWLDLEGQVASLENNYLDAVKEMNDAIIELRYLTSE